MDEKKLEEKLKKIWDETPVSHSENEKEASWESFQSKAFTPKKSKFKVWQFAAAAVLLFGIAGTVFFYNSNPLQNDLLLSSTVVENTTSIVKIVMLPDSSKVELSANSKITYASNFAVNRKMEIEGEAYFKVKKDKKHPFQVLCNDITTTVLGTSFVVKENTENGTVVELYEGSVQINIKNQDKKWILEPGDKFTYAHKIAAITDFNRFTDFDNDKLSTVTAYIQKSYGYKVAIPAEYLEKPITIRINKKEDLKDLVQLLAEMYNLNFEINEELKEITFQ
jgi:ferric-dicitrate binding protein FerR (iron transport regulator)